MIPATDLMKPRETPPETKEWPNCVELGGICFAYDIVQLIGAPALYDLLNFIHAAEPGSRMSIQKKKDGLTMQVTGPIKATAKQSMELEGFRQLLRNLTIQSNQK